MKKQKAKKQKFYVNVQRTTTYEVLALSGKEAADIVFGGGREGKDYKEIDGETTGHQVYDEHDERVDEDDCVHLADEDGDPVCGEDDDDAETAEERDSITCPECRDTEAFDALGEEE